MELWRRQVKSEKHQQQEHAWAHAHIGFVSHTCVFLLTLAQVRTGGPGRALTVAAACNIT